MFDCPRICHTRSVGHACVGDAASSVPSAARLDDGPGRYELVGLISHMGSNLGCGHYVCHLKKEGRWVLYNDEKVAASEHPPKDLGYAYLFRRADVDAPAA